ncbi:zinc finger protein 267-like [Galleria mellonella]|uniref:Zinc finger protein 267-like n=1 Tax=Galleria mellonella TaxID=7137 RepID=A0ABM3MA03_GALME|nr:zinc finger protein 267-like [Galleria mellonella]XP_052748267.1 zinc finger protein 267-like [Galleria mellonella]
MEEINSSSDKYNLCSMCLSADRKLCRAGNIAFIDEISKIKLIKCLDICEMAVCWECEANMKNIIAFRNKVLKAQSVIRDLMKNSVCCQPVQSLSRLKPTIIDNAEIVMLQSSIDVKVENIFIEDPDVSEACDIPLENIKEEDEEYVGNNEESKDISICDENIDQNIYTVVSLSEEEMRNERDKRRTSSRFNKCTVKCVKCVEIFSNTKCLYYHMRRHDKDAGEFLCSICEQRFTLESEMTNHRLTHYRHYKCRICELEFHNEDLILRHHRDNHSENGYACEVCNTVYQTKRLYQLHRRSKHKGRKSCPTCHKELGPNTNLKKHMLTHTSVTYECEVCNKKYRNVWSLRTHRQSHNVQKNEAAYCAECDVQYKTVYSYWTHVRTSLKHVSLEDLKYKCKYCSKRCASASSLKYHMESVHTKEMNYSCKQCDQAFNTTKRLRVHVRFKHEGKSKPKNKICCICSKAFSTKVGLQQHMNSHTGARPYVCKVCEASFSHSGALYTHTKLLHKRQKRQKPDKTSQN